MFYKGYYAYRILTQNISLMKILNNNGPMIESCGTTIYFDTITELAP